MHCIVLTASRRIISFLYLNYVFIRYFSTLDQIQPDPPKMENFVTHPKQTQPDLTRWWTQPVSNSVLHRP